MNHSINSAPLAQRTMVAAAVVALFAAGSAGAQTQQAPYPYAHAPNTNENYITGNLPYGARPNSFDTTYNVCRGTDPACYHNWVEGTGRQMRVLVYSRTAGPRHGHLGTALTGRVTGKAYRLGDPIDVRVEAIVKNDGKVELAPA